MDPAILALLDAAAAKYELPSEVVRAVAWVESRGTQGVVSTAGAIGVMQLMPATAASLGVDPHDVAENIDGGVRFLANLWKRFGLVRLALAAYNWGPARVAALGDKESLQGAPEQVRTYVQRVLDRASYYAATADQDAAATAETEPRIVPSKGAGKAAIPFDRSRSLRLALQRRWPSRGWSDEWGPDDQG